MTKALSCLGNNMSQSDALPGYTQVCGYWTKGCKRPQEKTKNVPPTSISLSHKETLKVLAGSESSSTPQTQPLPTGKQRQVAVSRSVNVHAAVMPLPLTDIAHRKTSSWPVAAKTIPYASLQR